MKTWEKFLYGGLALYALAVHAVLLLAVPDPVIHSDSISYLKPALGLLFDHHFDLPPERTPGYPLFLYALLRMGSSFTLILVIQHILAIGTMVLTGLLARRALKLSPRFALAAAFASGVFPLSLLAAHSLLTETLYTFLSLLVLLGLFWNEEKEQPRNAGAAGFCAGAALGVRPAGWALGVALLVGLGRGIRKNKSAGVRNAGWACAALALTLAPVYYGSYMRYQVVGLTAFSGISLFGTTARYLEVDQVQDADIRRLLKPFFTDPVLRPLLADANGVRYSEKGPVAVLRTRFPGAAELDRVLCSLSAQAVRDHPLLFLAAQAGAFVDFVTKRGAVPGICLNRDFSFFVVRGLGLFERSFGNAPAALALLRHSSKDLRGYLNALAEVQAGSEAQANEALARLHQEDPYHYDRVLALWTPLRPFFPLLSWLPLAAFLSAGVLLKDPEQRFAAALLLIYLAAHIGLTNLGGDADPRHAVPLEPVYWILVCAGVSRWVQRKEVRTFFGSLRGYFSAD